MFGNSSKARIRPVIRVFVSSTFSDLVHERNALQDRVWPELERYCQLRGFQFQAIDLRWGIPTEAGLDHRTMRICFEELRRSQEVSPQPNFLILLGDVSGKGIGAALVMSSLNAACRALIRHVHAIEDVTFILNDTFVETTGAGTFVTMLIMLVDPVGKRVHFIRAGHNPPLTVKPSGEVVLYDNGGGPPVGLFSKLRFKREIANIEPGSVLVLYTDGVNEAENVAGEQIGLDRVVAIASEMRLNPAA